MTHVNEDAKAPFIGERRCPPWGHAISAADRAHTVRVLADLPPNRMRSPALTRLPAAGGARWRAASRGTYRGRGRLGATGLAPAGAIGELVLDDG